MLAAVSPASITSAGRIVALAPAHLAGTDAFDTLEETPERRFAAITHHLGDRRHREAAVFQQPSRFGRAPLREVLDRRLADGFREQLGERSEEHTSELPSLMRISYAAFCLKTTTSSIMSC